MNKEKGVGGIQILLSVVVLLFIVGLVVMVFALMGGELQGATSDATAISVINATTQSIAGVTTWFPIIIVITAMVVLILLTVLIITSIRQSGMVATA